MPACLLAPADAATAAAAAPGVQVSKPIHYSGVRVKRRRMAARAKGAKHRNDPFQVLITGSFR